ncbi:DUF397 domain-containing protein [Streptomyces sp. NPDC093085]|uniref:DUF397 domain-containing protein n=1 Tax=Streptomyces sp. NPDC093085 TaxID=3155068 RepID=UPI00343B19A6
MINPKGDLYAAPLDGEWEKSSFSLANGNDCVQVMPIEGGVAFGDTKRRDLDGALRFTDREMLAHILAVKAGQYDHLIPEGTEL